MQNHKLSKNVYREKISLIIQWITMFESYKLVTLAYGRLLGDDTKVSKHVGAIRNKC